MTLKAKRGLALGVLLTVFLGAAAAFQNCQSSGWIPLSGSPININSSQSGITVLNVINYGQQADSLDHFEIDGSFAGTNDNIDVKCVATSSPQFTVTSDTSSQILFTLSPINDTCTVSVQNSTNTTPVSLLVSLQPGSGTVQAWDSGTSSGADNIILLGTFAGSADQISYACDGNGLTPASAPTSDSVNRIAVSIPTPNNFTSCQFQVSGIASIFAVLGITGAADTGADNTVAGDDDVVLNGSFVGLANGGDQVFYACDGNPFSQVLTANVTSDFGSSVTVQIPTPNSFSGCQFYLVGNSFQSQTYTVP